MQACSRTRLTNPYGRVVLIALLALVLRILYIHESASSPLFEVPMVDARTYVDEAMNLAGGAWAGEPEPFWQPPLYPYSLAFLFWLCGEDYYLPQLLQALLGAAICVLIYVIGNLVFPPAVALGAGLAAACYGPLIYFGGELLPTIPAIFLHLLFLLSLVRPPCSDPWRWLLSGFLMGLSALAVANILLFLPFLLLWLFWHSRDVPGFRALPRAALLILGCVLAIAPVTVRNYVVGNDWVLISSNPGINFYIGNNPEYDRTVSIRPGRDWAMLVETPELEAGIERPSAKSRYFFARSWEFIAGDPLSFLKLLIRKLYLFWHGDEILRNLDPYYARNHSLVLGVLLWKRGLAFPFGLVAPLALLGIAGFWRSPAGRTVPGRLLLLFLLVYMLSVALFFVTSRHRLPAVTVSLLFAGYGLKEILDFGFRKKRLLFLFPVLLVATNLGAGPMDMAGDGYQHFALGYAYEQKGMQANAIREYRVALERLPGHRDSLLRLAALYANREQYNEAIEIYQSFLKHHPEAGPVRFMLGNIYLAIQRYEEAIATYERLVPVRSQWAELFGRLGYAYLMAEQPSRAVWAYRRTLAIRPDSSLVRYQLAQLYEAQDSLQAAVEEYLVLLDGEPDNPEFHVRLANLLIKQEEAGKETVRLQRSALTRAAETYFRQAIWLAPNHLNAHWNLGMMLARQDRYLEAIEHFEQVLNLSPENYQAHFCLANLYRRTGREEEAQRHMTDYARARRERRLQEQAYREAGKQIERIFNSQTTGQNGDLDTF